MGVWISGHLNSGQEGARTVAFLPDRQAKLHLRTGRVTRQLEESFRAHGVTLQPDSPVVQRGPVKWLIRSGDQLFALRDEDGSVRVSLLTYPLYRGPSTRPPRHSTTSDTT